MEDAVTFLHEKLTDLDLYVALLNSSKRNDENMIKWHKQSINTTIKSINKSKKKIKELIAKRKKILKQINKIEKGEMYA